MPRIPADHPDELSSDTLSESISYTYGIFRIAATRDHNGLTLPAPFGGQGAPDHGGPRWRVCQRRDFPPRDVNDHHTQNLTSPVARPRHDIPIKLKITSPALWTR